MKRLIIQAVVIFCFVLAATLAVGISPSGTDTAEAHPGNTDGNGCHTCRTNCSERWGISYGYYHRHNPVRACFALTSPPTSTPPPPPTSTRAPPPTPTEVPTDTFVKPTRTPRPENPGTSTPIPTLVTPEASATGGADEDGNDLGAPVATGALAIVALGGAAAVMGWRTRHRWMRRG